MKRRMKFTLASDYWLSGTESQPNRSHIWAKLERLTECVKFNRGDLYHDALWIEEIIKGEIEFYYGVREAGTTITTEFDEEMYGVDEATYRINVYKAPNGGWRMGVHEVSILVH